VLYLGRLVHILFRVFLQGLIGKGYFITPVALGFCALLLVMFKDRPVKAGSPALCC
jgi:hypothetical protein